MQNQEEVKTTLKMIHKPIKTNTIHLSMGKYLVRVLNITKCLEVATQSELLN